MYLLPIVVKILILHMITWLIAPALLITIIYLCVCSPPDESSGARHHRSQTEHVRYLLRSSGAINLGCVPVVT